MSKHKPEDPWAGFVDVLSSILMVVIFLIVILGVAIFGISQQITKVAVEGAIKAEREKQGAPPSPPPPRLRQMLLHPPSPWPELRSRMSRPRIRPLHRKNPGQHP